MQASSSDDAEGCPGLIGTTVGTLGNPNLSACPDLAYAVSGVPCLINGRREGDALFVDIGDITYYGRTGSTWLSSSARHTNAAHDNELTRRAGCTAG